MKARCRTGLLLGLVALLFVGHHGQAPAEADSNQPPLNFVCTDSDRFGVWHSLQLPLIEEVDVGRLHAGWWNHWNVVENPAHPADMRFVQLVRIAQGEPPTDVDAACFDAERPLACPTWDAVGTIARANPGSLWLIGNEPDRQDYVEADRYAEIYHEFYTFLKAEDPTCQVGIGGVVQPTPIRLEYLDEILQAYQTQNGDEPMPVDVWNVHNYVLREKKMYEDCPDCWGCGVPPGGPNEGELYGLQDHDDLEIWTGHLTAMRQWMADRGYRDRPLIVSEFGILMPEFYGYDYARVRDFMLATFEWMMTANDPDIGYPADGNRLVQAWSWFGLAESTLEGLPLQCRLFDPDTKEITRLGVTFGSYTTALTDPVPGSVDLKPVAVLRGVSSTTGGGFVDATIIAKIANDGAAPAGSVLVRVKRDGEPSGEATISNIAPGTTETASVLWTDLIPGQTYEATVSVEADIQTIECNPFNNLYTTPLIFGDRWIYLPVINKRQ
ncbi:CARDB domain-containing protein [Chloroflexota bacterium]